jgi:hypothetical protein
MTLSFSLATPSGWYDMHANDLTALNATANLPQIISDLYPQTRMKPRGGTVRAVWRNDRLGSCSVFKKEIWFYRDHGAHESGNSYQFLIRRGLSHQEAIEALKGGFIQPIYISNLSPSRKARGRSKHAGNHVATYDYTNASGKLLYQVLRYEPKRFLQRKPAHSGRWIWDVEDVPKVLYQLPRVVQARRLKRGIFVVEGEKDADLLISMGFTATTHNNGAHAWNSEIIRPLIKQNICLIRDFDAAGIQWAENYLTHLDAPLVCFPFGPGYDTSDYVKDYSQDGLLSYLGQHVNLDEFRTLGLMARSQP